MASIFDDEDGNIRSKYKEVGASNPALQTATPSAPFSIASLQNAAVQFFVQNETDQEVQVYLRAKSPRFRDNLTANTGWQLLAAVGAYSPFALGDSSLPNIQVPAGTEVGLVMASTPTTGKIRLFIFG